MDGREIQSVYKKGAVVDRNQAGGAHVPLPAFDDSAISRR